MSIYIVKDKTKKKLNIPATDVQLLDIDGKFENKNLEDVIVQISDTEHLHIGEVDTKKNGFWIDNNEILDSKENNGVVDRLKNYFNGIVGDLKTLTTNSKDTLVNAINENTSSINQLSNPNLLINGDFQVWQRGTSFISTENKIAYGTDRWFTMQKGIKVERVTNTSPSMSEFALRLTTQSTSEQGQSYLVQPIENNSRLEGKTVTLSFWIKGIGKSTSLNCRVGNEKNKQSIINLTQEWQFVKITQKANFDTTTKWNSGVIFYTVLQSPYSEGDGYEIAGVKLEVGDKATPFIPRSYGEELALCQKYYQTHYLDENVLTTDYSQIMKIITLPTTMRVAPTSKALTKIYFHQIDDKTPFLIVDKDGTLQVASYDKDICEIALWFVNNVINNIDENIKDGMVGTLNSSNIVNNRLSDVCKISLDAEIY